MIGAVFRRLRDDGQSGIADDIKSDLKLEFGPFFLEEM